MKNRLSAGLAISFRLYLVAYIKVHCTTTALQSLMRTFSLLLSVHHRLVAYTFSQTDALLNHKPSPEANLENLAMPMMM